jgi:DNA invertase Pin-like site-specific DNA recombinase
MATKWDAALAGMTCYLIERSGRFHARIVIPKRLQPLIHKTELSRPLGSDRRLALSKIKAMRVEGLGASAIAKALKIGRASVHRALT